ncbi:DUF6452 family protein [Cellulophaga sp. Hel_I_12]|uniref:DUF6452 family protein n=1 Tax=Cellulophaga sp. Hel_I_12 TaxID=1249972 RepID=UPI00064595DC|nr:DUF6452 family protein [Cellulophaga sp. Hel_I_12]
MKKIIFIVILIIIFIGINSCEKDDICVDGTTPLLVIRFYDNATDTETLKAPQNLRIKGQLEGVTYGAIIPNTAADSIQLPLKIDAISTTFSFTTNTTTDAVNDNEDVLTFDYSTTEVFVSRACGFIANYQNLSERLTTDSNNWIKRIEIVKDTIENQNAAHVKIFH